MQINRERTDGESYALLIFSQNTLPLVLQDHQSDSYAAAAAGGSTPILQGAAPLYYPVN